MEAEEGFFVGGGDGGYDVGLYAVLVDDVVGGGVVFGSGEADAAAGAVA